MYIQFHNLEYKNILSTGNYFNRIELDRNKTTLLAGDSGAGKSTLLDAITFVLFGKPFRFITKAQMLNSVNEKDLEVRCEFSVGGKRYQIIRGVKPNVFEVYCDGTLLNQSSSVKDYQSTLENEILRFDYRAFKQVIVLGAADYVPFMQLGAADRRGLIEDLLNIGVFSTMSGLLKEKYTELKLNIASTEKDEQSTTEKIALVKSFLESQNADIQERIQSLVEKKENIVLQLDAIKLRLKDSEDILSEKKQALDEVKKKESDFLQQINDVKSDRLKRIEEQKRVIGEKYAEHLEANERAREQLSQQYLKDTKEFNKQHDLEKETAISKLDDQIKRGRESKTKNETKIEALKEQVEFYSTNDSCPTCQQPIADSDVCQKKLAELKADLQVRVDKQEQIKEALSILFNDKERVKDEFDAKKRDFMEKLEETFNLEKAKLAKIYQELVSKRNKEQSEAETSINEQCASKIDFLNSDIAELKINDVRQAYDICNKELQDIQQKERLHQSQLKSLVEEIETLSKPKNQQRIKESEEQLEALLKQKKRLVGVIGGLRNTKEIYDIATVLLKDGGIKSRIIKHYLPLINNAVNSYLNHMNFSVNFELDAEFKENITSRHRDNFSYANFSEGEKQRIDLAMLFAWRSVAKAKNSIHANILILDEILDSYLSDAATQNVIDMLYSDALNDTNVFVISHKDNIADRFERVLRFEKRGDFSYMLND